MGPRFSIVTPVHDPPSEAFRATAHSVLTQTSRSWEWIVVDDGSRHRGVLAQLEALSRHPDVVMIRLDTTQGVVGASNTGLAVARGEYVAFLDHDDELTGDALQVVGDLIDGDPSVDFVYTDETKVDEHGNAYDWFAKPEWSLERLRGQNYCNHLAVFRRSIVDDVGRLRPGFDGAQDHDLVLRVVERTDRIAHVPKVLYRWRAVPGSTAHAADAKPAAREAGRRAVEEHLRRVGLESEVTSPHPGRYLSKRRLRTRPLVSIVIPTRGDARDVRGVLTPLVTNAVQSVLERSTYDQIEVVIVADTVTPSSVRCELADMGGATVRMIEWTEPFDFARKINLGAVHARGEIIVLLNDDVEVITPDWIEVLVGYLLESDVGMVGPMLVLADGRVQSAGHHYHPTPFNLGAGAPADDPGPHAMFAVAGERSGVTAACAALRRATFFEVGALSERFPNCYNDVDLGFKLLERGFRIVWTPAARLYHFETSTRDPRETRQEADELNRRWGRRLGDDPFARQIDEWWARVPLIPPVDTHGEAAP